MTPLTHRTFRLILATTLLLAAPCFPALAQTGSGADRPNLVIIMPDDMGYGDLGCTGNPVIRTPNLDRFAGESATLTDFYVSPVCSPTRAALMTGRYNQRTRVIDTYKGRSMMDPGETTVAELLREAGYATGIFGKWHLGDNYPLRPQDQGFDLSVIHRGGGLAQPSEPIENQQRYTDPILFRNGEQFQAEGYCTDVFFREAMEFIDQRAEEGRPFFATITPNAPHGPYHDVPEELLAHYREADLSAVLSNERDPAPLRKFRKNRRKHSGPEALDTLARVYAMVENIDQNVGRFLDHLDDCGLADNTLVLFFTDNGPNTPRYTGPFRGMKSHVHEGGIRTPFFARWPGRIEPGASSDRIAAHIDVLPTLLEAAGVEKPAGLVLDGRSLLPLLEGRKGEWPDRTLVLQSHRGNQPDRFHHIGVRSQRWKLVHPSGFGSENMPGNVPFELYDMKASPSEQTDLAAEHPGVVTKLKEAYDQWFEDVSTTREDNWAPPRIVVGNDAENPTVLSIQDWRVPDGVKGWGEGGEWLLDFARDGNYRVEVVWDEPVRKGRALVRIGEQEFPVALPTDATRVSLEKSVPLPAGEASLRVHFPGDQEQPHPRFVVLERE